ncbi:helix-turn-helix transcriptional regulator [Candidatus Woesearchaeota archaeon]|nr:helix-turn-helix transcriptional regulator [Candidatus Woesearchaeota archaeon]
MIFKTIAGYTTNKFASELNIAYPWIYNLEHKKSKIGEKGAKNIADKTFKLFNRLNLLGKVTEKEFILNYNSLNNIKIESDLTNHIEKLSNKGFDEFKDLYEKIKGDTKNFNYFPSSLLLQDSRVILPLRIILGLTQKEFANKAKIAKMTAEELENGYRKLRWRATARRYSEKIEKIIRKDYKEIDSEELKNRWQKWKNTRKIKPTNVLNWKRIKEMKAEDFLKYFQIIKKETSQFTKITPEILQNNPQAIMIFRILAGLTQRELERKISSISKAKIYNYENLIYSLSRGNAEIFSEFFNKEIKNISEEEAINKFLHTKESMFSYRKGALNNLKKMLPNEQEEKIIRFLQKQKSISEKIKIHENIETKNGIVNVDLLIEDKDNLIIIIEATKFHDTESRKFGNNWKQKIFLLDYRFIKIKKRFPKILTYIAIEMPINLQLEYRIKKFVKEQTIAIDDIFINQDFERLNNIIGGK